MLCHCLDHVLSLAIQKAKKEQMEEAKRMEEQKTTEQKPVSSEAVADSTVTVRLV
jgi:hypothetical protein